VRSCTWVRWVPRGTRASSTVPWPAKKSAKLKREDQIDGRDRIELFSVGGGFVLSVIPLATLKANLSDIFT